MGGIRLVGELGVDFTDRSEVRCGRVMGASVLDATQHLMRYATDMFALTVPDRIRYRQPLRLAFERLDTLTA